jgi:transcriptional regulator with XRE-family HTH domain
MRAGISYRYFQNIESGAANLTLSTLFKLSRFFNVRVDEMLRERSYRDINTPL